MFLKSIAALSVVENVFCGLLMFPSKAVAAQCEDAKPGKLPKVKKPRQDANAASEAVKFLLQLDQIERSANEELKPLEGGRGLHERYAKLVNKYAEHPQCLGCAKSFAAELKTAMDKMKAIARKAKSCTKDDAPVLKQEFQNVQFQLGDVVRAVKECLQTLEYLEEKSKSESRKDYLHHTNQQVKIAGILKDG